MPRATSAAPDADSLLLVGRIWRAHGVQGEVKVIPETDEPSRLQSLASVFVGASPAEISLRNIQRARLQQTKKGVLVVIKLEGINGREEADALRQQALYASRSDLPPLADDEFFIHDLIGLKVVTSEGEAVGYVKDYIDQEWQALLVVAREVQPDVLVPAVPAFIETIDLDEQKLVIQPIDGLLE